MTDLDKITTEVTPTSLNLPKEQESKSIDILYEDLVRTLNFNLEEHNKFKEGINLEKLNRTQLLRMMLEVVVEIVDNSKKQQTGDKNDDALFQQNKKVVRDLAFSLFSVLNNYSYNDRQVKVLLLGKLIQSLYGSR